jgi:hypothetical protein
VKSTKDEESIFLTTMVANNLNKKLPFVYLPRRSIEMEALSSHTLSGSKWILEAYSLYYSSGGIRRSAFVNTRHASDPSIKHPVAFCPMVQQMDSGGDLTITAQIIQ